MRLFLLTLFLLPALLSAQSFPHFNPKTVQKFQGEITNIETYGNITRPSRHKQMFLRTLEGEVVVDLGPEWYIDQQNIPLFPGEKVEVEGSLLKFNGTLYVIATSLTIDGTIYKLRDRTGLPVWRNR